MSQARIQLELMLSIAEIEGNNDEVKRITKELHDLKKKEAKHGRRS